MIVTVVINKCEECRHRSHSGMLDPEGARPECHHPERTKASGRGELPHNPAKLGCGMVKPTTGIPNWCPLQCGARY